MDELDFMKTMKAALESLSKGDTEATLEHVLEMLSGLNDRIVELQLDDPDDE
jgi:hypothetical protein